MEKLKIKIDYSYGCELDLEIKVAEDVKDKIISDIMSNLNTAMENVVIRDKSLDD